MAVAKPFSPVKLICGILFSDHLVFEQAETVLTKNFGRVEKRSASIDFTFTDYYDKQMGSGLKKKLLSFSELIDPGGLSRIKLQTNRMEDEIKDFFKSDKRIVNLDPGTMSASALVMATVKDFAHRIPLQEGIYGHLELLFTKKGVKILNWTYPDFRTEEYHRFFIEIRKSYLEQLRQL
ncbi:MAG: DUF4416 family protein [Candidatus Aminicenantes bacterium]|nr:DUF4416 family protein [Candidatus Aminicenantes bacterium]